MDSVRISILVIVMVRISTLLPSVTDRVNLGLGLGLPFGPNNLLTLTQKLALTLTFNTNPMPAREHTVVNRAPSSLS